MAQTHRRSTVSWWWVLGGVVVLGGLAFAAWPKPLEVEVEPVIVRDVVVERVEEGRAEARRRYVAVSPVAGDLEALSWKAGDRVRAGEALVRLRPAAPTLVDARARAEVNARLRGADQNHRRVVGLASVAQTGAVAARREAARLAGLASAGAVARQLAEEAESAACMREDEASSARSAVAVAAAEVAALRAVLADPNPVAGPSWSLDAPWDGVVLRVNRESAGFVAPGTPILEIGDLDGMEFVADFPSQDAMRIASGTAAQVEVGPHRVPAWMYRVEPSAFTRVSALGVEEQRVNIWFRPQSSGSVGGLGDGYRVDVRVELARAERVNTVSEAAVFAWGDAHAVYVVDGRMLRLRPVVLGVRDGAYAEVRDGLREGEEVVLDPSDAVDDGVRFRRAKTKRPSGL